MDCRCGLRCLSAKEEMEAGFAHHATAEFPVVKDNGKNVRVVVGSLYGASSPVPTVHETIFGDVHLKSGSKLPLDAGHEERAVYIIDGVIDISGDKFEAGRLLVFKPGDTVTIAAETDTHFVILGGAPMDGPRHIWWNFVSSRKERIEQAKGGVESRPFRHGAGRRDRVHPAARQVKLPPRHLGHDEKGIEFQRHGRACPGHRRLPIALATKCNAWIPAFAGMTPRGVTSSAAQAECAAP